MDRRHAMKVLTAGGAASMLPSCRSVSTLHYRLSVFINTPDGIVSGSTIRKHTVKGPMPWLPGGNNTRTEIVGNALVIELPKRVVFMPVSRWHSRLLRILRTYGTLYSRNGKLLRKAEGIDLAKLKRKNARIELSADNTDAIEALFGHDPEMVFFSDPNRADSLTRIDPNTMEAYLGLGVSLSHFRFEVTRDPVSTGLEERLSWFPASDSDVENIHMRGMGPQLYGHNVNGMFVAE